MEMPGPAAASNLAWEFVWGFLLVTNLGVLFQYGLRVWFIMDVFIFIYMLKYGAKQFNSPVYKKNFRWIHIVLLFVWIPVFYYFYHEGYDTPMGTTSAYLITVVMAVLFIINFINSEYKKYFSMEVAITKGLGNTFMTAFVFFHHQDLIFVKIMTIVVFFLNLIYIYIIFKHKHDNHVDSNI